MHIYFSGIGGTGIGPLAELSLDAGHTVSGSDLSTSTMTAELAARGATVHIGQDGSQIEQTHAAAAIDWFVYTAALPKDHPELAYARRLGIRTSKRDELLARIIQQKNLKLIAVAGTHGKTTTTGMLIWLFKQVGIPISYSLGSTISFGPSGKFDPASEYFIYECDEYDRNFLHFSPHLSILPSVDYDHPNIYPTVDSYKEAFVQFVGQSKTTICFAETRDYLGLSARTDILLPKPGSARTVNLAGEHNRRNAQLAVTALAETTDTPADKLANIINEFPGTARRFEKLADNLYSDYGHHPIEIAATLQMARELSEHVVLVYQPHQNLRQHELRDQYAGCMQLAEEIYWLPTYLSREKPGLAVLSPGELIAGLANAAAAEPAEMNQALWETIQAARSAGKLVLAMGAGTIDGWIRGQLRTVSGSRRPS